MFAILVAGASAAAAAEQPPAQLDPQVRQEIDQFVGSLDSEAFASRERAFEQLGELADRAELRLPLAAHLKQSLEVRKVSLEAQARIVELLGRLPDAEAPIPKAELSRGEITKLLDQLNAASATDREHAAIRIKSLLRNPRLVCPLIVEMKSRLADPEFNADGARQVEQLWIEARGLWLLSDPKGWSLPEVTEAQISGWIDDLAFVDDEPGMRLRRKTAERELVDVLARDEYVAKVRTLLAARIDSAKVKPTFPNPAPQPADEVKKHRVIDARGGGGGWVPIVRDLSPYETAQERLERVYEWARPAMVAEVWINQEHKTIQHMLVGVPQYPEGAPRATHFDRIDDRTAHCVSGNQLLPGDYPVGVAIPHPQGAGVTFHLINLPTPRQRMAYDYLVKRPEADRLREISQRTVDALLADKHRLNSNDCQMLLQLDPKVAASYAARYLATMSDEPFPPNPAPGAMQPPNGTVHTSLCRLLAYKGDHEAIPALTKVASRGNAEELGVHSPYECAWLAALMIAARDPWPEMDDWLAEQVSRDTLLVNSLREGPELGACAAALLLTRNEMAPSAFGVQNINEQIAQSISFNGYRFSKPENRQKVLDWWQKQKARKLAQSS